MAQHGGLVLVGRRHTSCGLAGSAFSLGCLPTKGSWAPAVVGKPQRGSGPRGCSPRVTCVMGVGETFPHNTFVVAGDPFHVGGKSDLSSNEVSENPDLGTGTQR